MSTPLVLGPRRFAAATLRVSPAHPSDVPPGLRFMLSAEALEEAGRFYSFADGISFSFLGASRVRWAEKWLIGSMSERWPHIARADAAIGGLLSQALRAVAAKGEGFPRWWMSIPVCLANGHPEHLRSCCERVIAHADAAFAVPEGYDEEAADPYLMKASGNFSDRDLNDDEALRKVLETSDEIPF